MNLRVIQAFNRERQTRSCFNFLLAFMEDSSGSPWEVMGDNFFYNPSFEEGAERAPEHRASCLQLFYFYVNGGVK